MCGLLLTRALRLIDVGRQCVRVERKTGVGGRLSSTGTPLFKRFIQGALRDARHLNAPICALLHPSMASRGS